MNLLPIFISSILTENIVLTKFLGICPFVGVSNKRKSALGMGLAVTFVVFVSSIITFLIYHYVLVPSNTEYLRTILFILVIASFVQLTEIVVKRFFEPMHKILGIYLPLITTNCAVLGIILLTIFNELNFLEALTFAVGSSLGFILVIYIFSTIRERLEGAPIIKSFQGFPIALITAGIIAMIFSRYIGV
jgi:Na+-translocating ferredoxin:NAD+ oxidoreductase subunit A